MRLRRWVVFVYPLGVESPSSWAVYCLPKDSAGITGIMVFVNRSSKTYHLASVPDSIYGEGTALLFIDRVSTTRSVTGNCLGQRSSFHGQIQNIIFKLLGTRLDMYIEDHQKTNG